MAYRNREIEVKLIVEGTTLTELYSLVAEHLSQYGVDQIVGKSTDWFWTLPEEAEGDFLRLRDLGSIREITVKARDRNLLNRLEVEIQTKSSLNQCKRLIKSMYGKPQGDITKEYYVLQLEGIPHSAISVYDVQVGDQKPFKDIMIEIEMLTESNVLHWEREITDLVKGKGLKIYRAPGSLYEMFIRRDKLREDVDTIGKE